MKTVGGIYIKLENMKKFILPTKKKRHQNEKKKTYSISGILDFIII